MSELERLRALLGEMTPGPWEGVVDDVAGWVHTPPTGYDGEYLNPPDARGIVASRNLLPSLLAVVEAALAPNGEMDPDCAFCVVDFGGSATPVHAQGCLAGALLADIRKELGE